MHQTLDSKQIELLRDIPNLTPVTRDYFEDWNIRVYDRKHNACKNYLSPNRRDFYKILFIGGGEGVFTLGTATYYIEEPTILFIHPNEIISWRNLSDHSTGHYCLFKKRYIDAHPLLRSAMDKFKMFSAPDKSVIRLKEPAISTIENLFQHLHTEALSGSSLTEDAMQAYVQLILVESAKHAEFPKPDAIHDEYRHIHQFFRLLEEETSGINYDNPVRLRTAKEFADSLAIHPNYLNALLKKHTGQNVSTHIKNRLLEESKALLLQTDWTLQNIGLSIGFSDQPNFSVFFKRNAGITPNEFRKSYQS